MFTADSSPYAGGGKHNTTARFNTRLNKISPVKNENVYFCVCIYIGVYTVYIYIYIYIYIYNASQIILIR